MKNQQKRTNIEDKKEQKKRERELGIQKALAKSKDVAQIVKLNNAPVLEYKGESIHVSTSGSKSVKDYVSKAVGVLNEKKEVMLFGYDKATAKLVTTVQLIKKQIPNLKQNNLILSAQGKSKMQVVLTKQ